MSAGALIEVRVTAIRFAARDINLYEFERPDGSPLPSAEPGAHIDLHLPTGLVRQYSLVTAGRSLTNYTIGVKRDPNSRGGSRYVHDGLKAGDLVNISHPRNNFPLDPTAAHSVLLAGGIGITPVWCMAQRLKEEGRSWRLYYACRTRADAAFLKPLGDSGHAVANFDDENGGKFLDMAAIIAEAPGGSHFYCCGPLPMLDAYRKATAALPPAQVHLEYFSAPTEAADVSGLTLELACSKKILTVPAGKTILEVVRAAGVSVVSSCEQGICGACETKVLSGIPDHRDTILSDAERAEGKTMMICCSGAKSDRLVLDL